MREEWDYRSKIKLLTGALLIILAVYLSFKYILVFLWPFVIGGLLALLIEKPVNRLAGYISLVSGAGRRRRGKGNDTEDSCRGKGTAAGIIVSVIFLVVIAVLVSLLYLGVCEIRAFISNFDYNVIAVRQQTAKMCLNLDAWLGLEAGCSMDFLCRCGEQIMYAFSNGGDGSKVAAKILISSVPFVKGIVLVFGGIIVGYLSVIYLSVNLEKIRAWKRQSIFRSELRLLSRELKKLLNVYFKVQMWILLINSGLCIVALFIIRNPYAVVVGVLIGVIDALPIFGTGTVLIPWAVVMLLMKNYAVSGLLLALYVVTYFVREIMESKCMGSRLGIAPMTMLAVIFVGLLVYGIIGFITGPVSYMVIKTLIGYWKKVVEEGMVRHDMS